MIDAIKELYFYKVTNTCGSFNSALFALISKADANNLDKLFRIYPEFVMAVRLWNEAGDYGNDLFRKYGLMK